jgi:hypothetical protein
MARHTALLLLLFTSLICLGCGSTPFPLREQGELRGKVYVLGNEPFTKVGLALDERDFVVLLCSPEVDTLLRSHQGSVAKIIYDGTSQVPEGQAVRVTTAEMVPD